MGFTAWGRFQPDDHEHREDVAHFWMFVTRQTRVRDAPSLTPTWNDSTDDGSTGYVFEGSSAGPLAALPHAVCVRLNRRSAVGVEDAERYEQLLAGIGGKRLTLGPLVKPLTPNQRLKLPKRVHKKMKKD